MVMFLFSGCLHFNGELGVITKKDIVQCSVTCGGGKHRVCYRNVRTLKLVSKAVTAGPGRRLCWKDDV